jgi:hypothetical protein
MKLKIFSLLLIGSLSLATFQGCKKDNNTNAPATVEDSDLQASQDNALAENSFNDAFNISDDAIRSQGSLYKNADVQMSTLSGCANVTLDTSSGLKKLTIDFGSTGCTGNDGRTRTGKIIITLTGRYRAGGTVTTITFDNYYVDSNKVEGTKTVTNMGPNAAGHPVYKIEVTGAKITLANGQVIKWESSRTREMTAGYNTPNILDDEYAISGSARGTNRNGQSYMLNITSPLIVKIGCRFIEGGTMELTPSGKATRTIDYGNGSSCDDLVTVTINGKVHNFHMR